MNISKIEKKYQLTEEQWENLTKIYKWLDDGKDLPEKVELLKDYFTVLVESVMNRKEYCGGKRERLNRLVEEYNKNLRKQKLKR